MIRDKTTLLQYYMDTVRGDSNFTGPLWIKLDYSTHDTMLMMRWSLHWLGEGWYSQNSLCIHQNALPCGSPSYDTAVVVDWALVGWVLLYVRRNHRLIRDGSPGRPPRFSHSSWVLTGHKTLSYLLTFALWRCRRHASKGPKTRSWWDKTREEDRIAELSQLGMASKVIVDTGRHMGYGKHPPTRRKHRTADDNPPIFIVPGSAVSQITTEAEIVNDSDASNLHGQQLGTPGASADKGGHSEAKVLYSASAGSNPVVFISAGRPATSYDIPKLTIKELD